jgi:hypothetical protein
MERVKANNSSSGNVATYGWEAEPPCLEVEFASRKGNSVYQYPGVPQRLWHGLLQAHSAGNFLNSEIKPLYPATKVS